MITIGRAFIELLWYLSVNLTIEPFLFFILTIFPDFAILESSIRFDEQLSTKGHKIGQRSNSLDFKLKYISIFMDKFNSQVPKIETKNH